jgi:hypothetical protein
MARRGHGPFGGEGKAKASSASSYQPGQPVTWLHTPRGGYGYTYPVNAVVVKVGKKRVQLEAPLKDGNTKLVWVKPANLRPRPWPRPSGEEG